MIREIGRPNGTDLSLGDIMGNVVNCFLFLLLSVGSKIPLQIPLPTYPERCPSEHSLFSFSKLK